MKSWLIIGAVFEQAHMKSWFMYDNHTFARVDLTVDHEALVKRAMSLFNSNEYGSLFVRDECGTDIKSLTLHGPVRFEAVDAWASKIKDEISFRHRMSV